LIPESELQPIIKHIIEQFVNDRCSEQAMTMGLNTLREVVLKNSGLLDS
jgi:protein SDA1